LEWEERGMVWWGVRRTVELWRWKGRGSYEAEAWAKLEKIVVMSCER